MDFAIVALQSDDVNWVVHETPKSYVTSSTYMFCPVPPQGDFLHGLCTGVRLRAPSRFEECSCGFTALSALTWFVIVIVIVLSLMHSLRIHERKFMSWGRGRVPSRCALLGIISDCNGLVAVSVEVSALPGLCQEFQSSQRSSHALCARAQTLVVVTAALQL